MSLEISGGWGLSPGPRHSNEHASPSFLRIQAEVAFPSAWLGPGHSVFMSLVFHDLVESLTSINRMQVTETILSLLVVTLENEKEIGGINFNNLFYLIQYIKKSTF